MTHRIYSLSPSGEHHHIVTADTFPDAVAIARRTHAERTGDSPDAIHVTARETLHPFRWTPTITAYEQDWECVR